MREVKNLRQNILVLVFAVCFAAFGFTGESGQAQTKNVKKTPTPAKAKSSPSPVKKESSGKTSKSESKSKSSKDSKPAEKSKGKTEKTATTKDKKSSDKAKTKTAEVKPKAANASKNTKSGVKQSNTGDKVGSPKNTAAKTKTADKKPAPVKPFVAKTIKTTPIVETKPKRAEISPQIIVNVTSARIRNEPALGSPTLAFAKLGSQYTVLEQTARWYKVRLSDSGKTGWISMEVANDFDASKREAIYADLFKKFYREDEKDFHTSAEVFEFLTRARDEAASESSKAELSFKRYLALRAALKAIPGGKSDDAPYRDFLAANEAEIIYSEPSAEWLVRANLLWELFNNFAKTPVAEEIAWLAAQNPIPGECEGYTNCYIYLIRVTDGEYLNFYPNGKHAQAALKHITEFLEPIAADAKDKKVYIAPADTSDRADFNQLLTELRNIISKLSFTEKSKAIQQINQIAEGYR